MHDYRVFGGVLRSELEFPELRRTHAAFPDWTLVCGAPSDLAASSVASLGEPLGEANVDHGVDVRSYRVADGFRLAYDDSGVFDISGDGRRITWHPMPTADLAAVRLDVLGRVLAFTLHASGWLTLHGSAVALSSGAIAFLAPKGSGKSTLAFAMMRAGATLLSDDTVAVDSSTPLYVRPGVESVRLLNDSAERLAGRASVASSLGKATFAADHRLEPITRVPLDAVYLLESAAPDAPCVERELLGGPPAVFGVLAETKIGSLLGGTEAHTLFDRVVTLAENASVYRLRVARNYDALDLVVDTIMDWHSMSRSREVTQSTR